LGRAKQDDQAMISMKKINEPFMFWLIHELFGTEEQGEQNLQPLSNKEVIAWMAVITVAFLLLSWLVGLFTA
jgi:hypothetical protein